MCAASAAGFLDPHFLGVFLSAGLTAQKLAWKKLWHRGRIGDSCQETCGLGHDHWCLLPILLFVPCLVPERVYFALVVIFHSFTSPSPLEGFTLLRRLPVFFRYC